MKLYTALSLLGLGLGAAGLVSTQACSSESPGGGVATNPGKQPVPKPDAPPTPATDEKTFAIDALYLGESDRKGVASNDAWKTYGFNLDGLATTRDSKDVCTRQASASAANQEDGPDGLDNAFGKVIMPFLKPFESNLSKKVTDSITAQGSFTIMLKLKGLTDDATQTNTGLSGTLLVGGTFDPDKKTKPTFTPATDWPYRADPQVPISGAYVNKGTFVNGSGAATVRLSIDVQGKSLDLTINRAIITFDHSAPNDATNGTIAGVIATDELVAGIENVAGRISPKQLCSGDLVNTIKNTIRQASDIMRDGTNKPGTACDAISIGIGFTARRIGNPTRLAPPETPPPDPCAPPADAGSPSDAASDG